MHAITYTEARENLAETLKRVCRDHDPVVVTRKREDAVVLISLEDYDSLTETAYLLRSPTNAQSSSGFPRRTGEGQRQSAEVPSMKIVFSSQAWEAYLY